MQEGSILPPQLAAESNTWISWVGGGLKPQQRARECEQALYTASSDCVPFHTISVQHDSSEARRLCQCTFHIKELSYLVGS